MPIGEQELREHLIAAARQAGPPSLTVESVAARIGRRRRLRAAVACACAAVVVALAVALPVALTGGGTSAPHGPLGGSAAAPEGLREPRFTVTVNGRHPSWLRFPATGDPKRGAAALATPVRVALPGLRLRLASASRSR